MTLGRQGLEKKSLCSRQTTRGRIVKGWILVGLIAGLCGMSLMTVEPAEGEEPLPTFQASAILAGERLTGPHFRVGGVNAFAGSNGCRGEAPAAARSSPVPRRKNAAVCRR